MRFDEQLCSPARLAIMASLVPGQALSFMELKRASEMADGNLHVQCKRLEGAGYIEAIRGQRGGRSWIRFRITEHGLAALKLHVRKLETILETETGLIAPSPRSTGQGDDSQVWSR